MCGHWREHLLGYMLVHGRTSTRPAPEALMSDPAEAWLAYGNTLRALQKPRQAFAAYKQALKHNPDLPGAWLGRGVAMRALKRADESLAAYDMALTLQPDF